MKQSIYLFFQFIFKIKNFIYIYKENFAKRQLTDLNKNFHINIEYKTGANIS